MRALFWYCDQFAWHPAMKTLEGAENALPGRQDSVVVAFIHIEPTDIGKGSGVETKLVKNAKWLARKWQVKNILLHSFTHLAEKKAAPEEAKRMLDQAQMRLQNAGYNALQTPYGYFLDLSIEAKGHPLARIFKEF